MQEVVHVTAYVLIAASWLVTQVSEHAEQIISKSFDAGLSIGLLTCGIVILGWYHWRYQKHHREVVEKLSTKRDASTAELHKLALQQIEAIKDQIDTNKDIRHSLDRLSNRIDKL